MQNDGLLVGTNWDANLFGRESEPLELALQIADQLISKGKDINLKNYQSIEDFHGHSKEPRSWNKACR
jgi:hypothetical protein